MPYINDGHRQALDAYINMVVDELRRIECLPGDVNCVVTRIVLESLKPFEGWSYHSLSDCVRVLRDSADEICRRLLGPYEDTAIRRNGDLDCFNEEFAYFPPLDVEFSQDDYAGCSEACCGEGEECRECRGLPPITEALTDDQFKSIDDERCKEIYTVEELAKACNVHTSLVTKWCNSGRLKHFRIPFHAPKEICIPRECAIEFLKEHGLPLEGLTG